MIHFICGSTGAGKSTYAAKPAMEIGAVRFCIDEWMTALYWQDAPQPLEATWVTERVARCQMLIWDTAKEVASRGIPCVLEIGFNPAKTRALFAAYAREAGLQVQMHFLDVSAQERWRRVEKRNADKSGPLGFDITRETFDFVEAMWEPPSPTEMVALNGIRIAVAFIPSHCDVESEKLTLPVASRTICHSNFAISAARRPALSDKRMITRLRAPSRCPRMCSRRVSSCAGVMTWPDDQPRRTSIRCDLGNLALVVAVLKFASCFPSRKPA